MKTNQFYSIQRCVVVALFLMSVTFNSCEESEIPQEAEVQEEEAMKAKLGHFMKELQAAAPKERALLIKDFENKNNITLATSPLVNETILNDGPPYEDLIMIGDSPGAQEKVLYPGYSIETFTWLIVQNAFGWWSVTAQGRCEHDEETIQNLEHQGSGIVGFTGGYISWEEVYNSVSFGGLAGSISVEGYLETPISSTRKGNVVVVHMPF